MMIPVKTISLLVTGRVQGVGYRHWLQKEAQRLQISGWCRNRREGAVEALLHGAESAVDALLQKCAAGPALARVDNLQAKAAEYGGDETFLVKDTV